MVYEIQVFTVRTVNKLTYTTSHAYQKYAGGHWIG